MILMGIGDEGANGIDGQIQATRELGWKHLEPRGVEVPGFAKANFHDIPDEAFDLAVRKLETAGIQVYCFGSTVMNWAKKISDPFAITQAEVKRAIPRLQRTGAKFIRIMSFKPGDEEFSTPPEVFRRVREVTNMFLDAGIQPVHENCMNYGGMSWQHTLELLDKAPGLKLVFDTANPIFNPDRSKPKPWPRQDAWEFWEQVRDHVVHIHIKDATWNPAKNDADYNWPGEGQGRVSDILQDAFARGYDAGISIEPHMVVVFHDAQSKANNDAAMQTNFIEYRAAIGRDYFETDKSQKRTMAEFRAHLIHYGGAAGRVAGKLFGARKIGLLVGLIIALAQGSRAATLTELFSFPADANPEAGLVQGNDRAFYGTTPGGGAYGNGGIFRITAAGEYSLLASFDGANGEVPRAGMIFGNDGALYGTTVSGGIYRQGTIFRVTTNGILNHLFSFDRTNGALPQASLALGRDGAFYGTTFYGGDSDGGTIFRFTTNGFLTKLHSFSFGISENASPTGALVEGGDGAYYGVPSRVASGPSVFRVTTNGGFKSFAFIHGSVGELSQNINGAFYATTSEGSVCKIVYSGGLTLEVTRLTSFTGTNGVFPVGILIAGQDGGLYGTTMSGGAVYQGNIFRVTTNGVFDSRVSLVSSNGAHPRANVIQGNDGKLYGAAYDEGPARAGTIFQATTNGDSKLLHAFTNWVGSSPQGELCQGWDGRFYGTTYSGGASGAGTCFAVSKTGQHELLASFMGTNGNRPTGGLIRTEDGTLFGATRGGGAFGRGTVFKVRTNGVLSTVASFGLSDGVQPVGNLIRVGGDFYGTTLNGGSNFYGTIFRMTPAGTLTTLYSFRRPEGVFPYAGLVPGPDGALYGTTHEGGSADLGTVFRFQTNGTFTTLCSFAETNGSYPWAGLVVGGDGALYGTTFEGGASHDGTVFRITTNGGFKILANLNQRTRAGLIAGSDGALYGVTESTYFRVTTNGLFNSLATLTGPNGYSPYSGLCLADDGLFYGVNSRDGSHRGGNVVRLNIGSTISLAARKSGGWQIGFTCLPVRNYRLLRAAEPVGPWIELTNVLRPTFSGFLFNDTNAASGAAYYQYISY